MLTSWDFDPVPTVGVGVAAFGYVAARKRLAGTQHRARAGRGRMACFGAGLLAIIVAVDGPPDVLSEVSLTAHMIQHLLLQLVAAPLLLLGGMLGLLLRADPPWLPRRVLARLLHSRPARLLAHPVTALGLFAFILVGSHLSPLYNLALEHDWLHEIEHIAYLVTALLFWWPAIGVDPAPHRLRYPARLLYLFLAMPVMAYLGLAIANASRVLYPYYAAHLPPWGASALGDQAAAGTIMWNFGTFTIVPALAVVLLRWLDEDERRQARLDARPPRVATPVGRDQDDYDAPQAAEALSFRPTAP
ncbi:MAG TPA: cytochrome c oxidase assembly protein [Streptosporangiaceae bacterium]